jgi:hypothetical protein
MIPVLLPLKVHATLKFFSTLVGAQALGAQALTVSVRFQPKNMRLHSYMF